MFAYTLDERLLHLPMMLERPDLEPPSLDPRPISLSFIGVETLCNRSARSTLSPVQQSASLIVAKESCAWRYRTSLPCQ